MALVKYGGGIVQMAGSIAGNVFARNRSGNYARARTVPVNPNSSNQQAARNAVSTAVTRWANTLTAAQRTAWSLYAANVAMLNRLGESINLSGFNHYVRSNSLLLRNGETPVDAGPTDFSLPETDSLFSVAGSEATQLLTVTFDDALAWASEDDGFMMIFMGMPQNAQINFFAGPWNLAGVIDGDLAIPITSPQTMTAPRIITQGQRVWVYARIVRADGRVSTRFRTDFSAGA
jgi:hypothetical protein